VLARDCILVSLSPTSLRVALTASGEVTRVERVAIDAVNFDDAWAQGLRPFDDALRSALRSLDVRNGSAAQVVYHSPRLFCEVFVAPTTGPAALQAARLHLAQSLPDAGSEWETSILPLLQVKDGATHRQVMLLSADTADNQNTLAAWLVRCGIKPQTVAPSKGVLLAHAVQENPGSDAPTVRISFDEHSMSLCGWVEGRLAFARSADVGYGLVIDAIHRATRSGTGELPPREYASRLLFSMGIPSRGQVLDPARGLSADAVLPLLQPALQRCIIEVRQTLRFGLQEQDVRRASIHLDGPGSVIPGITQSFFDHLEVDLTCRQRDTGPNSGVAEDQVGDLAIAARHRASGVWSVPPCERVRKENRRLTFCVRAGALVAVLLLGMIWGSTRRATARATDELAQVTPRAEMLQHVIQLREKTAKDAGEIASSRQVIDTALGRHTSWLGALALATQPAESELTILSVEGAFVRDAAGAPVLTIRGRTAPTEGSEGDDDASPVTALVERLSTSPLVAQARVVSAHSDSTGSEFVVEALLRSVPASLPITEGEARVQESRQK
jgi:hypothetical protein